MTRQSLSVLIKLQSVCKTLYLIYGDLVPMQPNNREKILEFYKEATNDVASDPSHESEIETINS